MEGEGGNGKGIRKGIKMCYIHTPTSPKERKHYY